METISEKFNSSLSSCDDRGKILVEDDGKDGGGKGGVGKIIHRPAKDLSFCYRHTKAGMLLGKGKEAGLV